MSFPRPPMPVVRYTHPNYFTVLVGELIVHVGLAFGGFLGQHNAALWYYLGAFGNLGFFIMGAAHGAITVMMLLGMYWRWSWLRVGLLLSVTVYILQTSFLTAGIVRSYVDPTVPASAIESGFYGLALILLSIAAYREPLIPGRYDARDEI